MRRIAGLTVHVHVLLIKTGDADESFAYTEGEGDRILGWWRAAHHSYYTRVLAGTSHVVNDDLEVVCEQFDLVYAE